MDKSTFNALRASFRGRVPQDMEHRRSQLEALEAFVRENDGRLRAAVRAELGRLDAESDFIFGATLEDVRYLRDHLDRLATPREVTPHSHAVPSPKGVVLIYGAFNAPTFTSLRPAAAAIAAGNCVVLKLPDGAPHSSAVLADLNRTMDARTFRAVTGDPAVSAQLMHLPWDHVLFTGSSATGAKVMAAAAQHLTPVTLELGGKNPVIVTRAAHIPAAANWVVTGRMTNAGQICVCPDYVLVEKPLLKDFLAAAVGCVRERYGDDLSVGARFGRVHANRFAALRGMLQATGGEVLIGGVAKQTDDGQCYISPTVVHVTDPDDVLLRDELFGPVLPVLAVDDVDQALDFVNDKPSPLSLYVFNSADKQDVTQAILDGTRSGNVCVNGTMVQFGPPGSFLGGVGQSGLGGAYGFDKGFHTFSHERFVLTHCD